MLPVSNLNDFATGGGRLNPLTGEFNPAGAPGADKFGNPAQNSNPFGFTAPTGPSTHALVPYYNKATGETWNAPGGGYTPPSADWLQGSPGNSTVAPLPGFAPGSGLDPVKSNKMPATLAEWQAQQGPQMTADVKPWAGTVDASGTWKANTPEQAAAAYAKMAAESNNTTPTGMSPPSGGASGLSGLVAPTPPAGSNYTPLPVGNINPTQPYMPIMGGNPNVGILSPAIGQQPRPMPQQPAPTPNTGGLSALVPQQPMVNRPASGLNSLVRPQPFMRNQIAPRAGNLPSLRFNPRLNQSLPIPFTRPTFRR